MKILHIGLLLVGLTFNAMVIANSQNREVENQYIVALKKPMIFLDDNAALQEYTQQTVLSLTNKLGLDKDEVEVIDSLNGFISKLNSQQLQELQIDSQVEFIEQDRIIKLDTVLNKSTYHELSNSILPWGLDRIDQRNLPLENSFTPRLDGTNVTVYVLDTGVDILHPEFGNRASYGYNGIDKSVDASDINGHGTHVAGIIGGINVGVAKNVNIVAVKVVDDSNMSTFSWIIRGFDWVNKNASKPSMINVSLGFIDHSNSLSKIVGNIISSGVSVITSAGNTNSNACKFTPNNIPNVVTVGATNRQDRRLLVSSWGRCVNVFAPGEEIYSAIPGDGYARKTGTSMAAPHVAGVAALYLQENNDLSPKQADYSN
ncbi:S8 family peptidase [Photobacterium leiognathi]|uniref:S8 family peptidase n=1 Tax=Photobacterium leiognathi TaxID=553611 RepID=UPI002739ECD4|nr:S8 family peptidase [Photobacterium leiognathi]